MVETLFIYSFIYLVSASVLTHSDVFMLRACKLERDHNQEGIESLNAAHTAAAAAWSYKNII